MRSHVRVKFNLSNSSKGSHFVSLLQLRSNTPMVHISTPLWSLFHNLIISDLHQTHNILTTSHPSPWLSSWPVPLIISLVSTNFRSLDVIPPTRKSIHIKACHWDVCCSAEMNLIVILQNKLINAKRIRLQRVSPLQSICFKLASLTTPTIMIMICTMTFWNKWINSHHIPWKPRNIMLHGLLIAENRVFTSFHITCCRISGAK